MSTPLHAVQLYALRDYLQVNLTATLRRVADIGFVAVELYRLEQNLDSYRAALEETGLTPVSSHASLLAGDAPAAIAAAADLGVRTLIEPRISADRWTNRADIEEAASELNAIAAQARDAGVQIGYHNHHEELQLDIDGTTGLEIFAAKLHDDVVLELDTFWVEVAGVSAVELLARLGERVKFLHIKDGSRTTDLSTQQPLGQGVMPVQSILNAAPKAVRIVELDAYKGDMFTAVEQSYAFLTAVDR